MAYIKHYTDFINESVPERKFSDKLPGGDARYEKRLNKYYDKGIEKFAPKLSQAKNMTDLLLLSREIAEYGFAYPLPSMLRNGATAMSATEKDIFWMTADRDSYESVDSLIKSYEKSHNSVEVNGVRDTYSISWDWWVCNIIRCLFFWKEPWQRNIDYQKFSECKKKYGPKCPRPSIDK